MNERKKKKKRVEKKERKRERDGVGPLQAPSSPLFMEARGKPNTSTLTIKLGV